MIFSMTIFWKTWSHRAVPLICRHQKDRHNLTPLLSFITSPTTVPLASTYVHLFVFSPRKLKSITPCVAKSDTSSSLVFTSLLMRDIDHFHERIIINILVLEIVKYPIFRHVTQILTCIITEPSITENGLYTRGLHIAYQYSPLTPAFSL